MHERGERLHAPEPNDGSERKEAADLALMGQEAVPSEVKAKWF